MKYKCRLITKTEIKDMVVVLLLLGLLFTLCILFDVDQYYFHPGFRD